MTTASPTGLVLMYHRICPERPDTACWFARGTAVTPERFAAQIRWLSGQVRFTSLSALFDEVLSGETHESLPPCALTFDDGYRDAQIATDLGLPSTIFAVAQHIGDSPSALWFDHYYGILHHARSRAHLSARDLGLSDSITVPSPSDDLRWWVRGPFKELLQTLPPDQRNGHLECLARTLEASNLPSPKELYFSSDELRLLRAQGHVLGGHGATHSRLTELSDDYLRRELSISMKFLDDLSASSAAPFCYPDGACDARVKEAAGNAGYALGCSVQEGVVTPQSDRFALPRIYMRNVLPEDPGWPSILDRSRLQTRR